MDYVSLALFTGYFILLVFSGFLFVKSKRTHILSGLVCGWAFITIVANYAQINLNQSGYSSMVIPNLMNQGRFVFYNLFILASFVFMKDSLKIFYFAIIQTAYVLLTLVFWSNMNEYYGSISVFNFCYFLVISVIYFGLTFRRQVLSNVYNDPATFIVIGFAVYSMLYLMIALSLWALFPQPAKAHQALVENYNYGFWTEIILLIIILTGLIRYYVKGMPSYQTFNSPYYHAHKDQSLVANKFFFLKPFTKGN